MARNGIGLRIADWRRIAGMTQQNLADAVAAYTRGTYTQAAVSMVESGKRAVDSRELIIAFAHALGISTTDIIGQPYPATVNTDLGIYLIVPAIRAALDEPDEPINPRTLDGLRAAVDQAMAARMACDYNTLGTVLPGVLAETRMLWSETGDPAAGDLLVRACVTGSLALKPAGWIDLAIRLAELADSTAAQMNDPVSRAAAAYTIAQAALASGNRRRSLSLAVAAAADLDRVGIDVPDRFAWGTMLNLHAALSAASLHLGGDAQGHLAEAGVLAARVEGDPWRMEACASNVDTWAVGVALEDGDVGRAPELARRVDLTGLRTKQRRARLHMDTGRALFISGNPDAAVRAFLAADNAAPGDLRMRPSAVEIVNQLVRTAPVRGGSDALRELAVRVGVDPLAPSDIV